MAYAGKGGSGWKDILIWKGKVQKMLETLKKEANMTTTINGGTAHRSTLSACLDLFAVCGAMRDSSEDQILLKFIRAFNEDRDVAMRILFYARDIRGGLGERRFFNIILKCLADARPASVRKNLRLIPEYGRFDDVTKLLGTKCEGDMAAYIKGKLAEDIEKMRKGEGVSLLAKWLPSVNASNERTRQDAKRICKLLEMRERDYRKTLSALRGYIGIVENNLRVGDYTFDYSKMSSRAMLKYRDAMMRHDGDRYSLYLDDVRAGRAKMNTSALYPYDIVRAALDATDDEERVALDTAWNALEDHTDDRNALVVMDGSGSMYCGRGILPATVALSLSIYFAERNRGAFAGHFITFSTSPRLVEIKGRDITDKVNYCSTFNEISNTDLSRVFSLILKTAIKNNVPQEEMPEMLYIISDMEFDAGVDCDKTVFEEAKESYEKNGYTLPRIVYWNVNSISEQCPVEMTTEGTALVSGASSAMFRYVMSGDVTPYSLMESVLSADRYKNICA